MISDKLSVLDNPVWHALQTIHKEYALGTNTIQRYPANLLQILGCENPATAQISDIEPWVAAHEKLYIVGEPVYIPENWKLHSRLDCVQMICQHPVKLSTKSTDEIIMLSDRDTDQMLDLINLVQPGYFHEKTPLLGHYFGIKRDHELVAMAGERLRMTGFTEISAVVTHPAYTGNGFAQQLVAHVANRNLEEGTLPFLHFVHTNHRAQEIYRLLGFTERKVIPFWQISRK